MKKNSQMRRVTGSNKKFIFLFFLLILFSTCVHRKVLAQASFDMQQWTGAWGSDGLINTGDLNGDGKTDVFMWKDAIKTWTVNISEGNRFSMQAWPGWGTTAKVYTGFLNNDRKTDIFFWDEMEKVWRINLSTGAGFEKTTWTGAWGSDGPINVGDLNKDKKTDVFMWRDSDKSWMVNLSTGSGFTMQRWTGAWGSDGPINVADLNGDEMDDVFMWRDSKKDWTVNLSTGSGFNMQSWKGAWGSDGQIHVGDLNGDKKTDVFMWRDSDGWMVNISNGNGFEMRQWVGACKQNYISKTGDFNGDGKTDVAIWKDVTKEWMINFSTGNSFKMETYTGAWGSDGPIFTGYLNNDQKTDIFMWKGNDNTWMMNLSNPLGLSLVLGLPSKFSDCFVGVSKLVTDIGAYPIDNYRGAGRAVAIAINPLNDKSIWVATPTGGIFKSFDEGEYWSHVDNFPVWGCFDISICPTDTNYIVISCIEDTKIKNGGGVWYTKNSGQSWFQANFNNGQHLNSRFNAYGICFQQGTNNIFIGTDSGFLFSHDFGTNWTLINPLINIKNSIYSILATQNGRVLTYGTAGIWISDQNLTGWHQDESKLSCTSFETMISDCWRINNAFAVSPINDNHIFFTNGYDNLFYSLDGGSNWKKILTDFPPNSERYFGSRQTYVKIGRQNLLSNTAPNIIELYYAHFNSLIYKQLVWNGSDYLFSSNWHSTLAEDPTDLEFSNQRKNLWYATNDAGVFRTKNYGGKWDVLSNPIRGYDAYQIYDVKSLINRTDLSKNHLFFGTQDNRLFASTDNGNSWPQSSSIEGGNFQGPNLLNSSNDYLVNYWNIHGLQYYYTGPLFTNHSPNLFSFDNSEPVAPMHYYIYYANGIKYFTFLKDINNPPKAGIYISYDQCKTWPSKPEFFIDQDYLLNPCITAGPSNNPSIILPYASNFKIGLLRIDNAFNETPNDQVIRPIPLPDSNCLIGVYGAQFFNEKLTSFGVDPHDPNFIIINDVFNDSVYLTYDGGINWSNISYNINDLITDNSSLLFHTSSNRSTFELPTTQVTCIVFDPLNSNNILIGTAESGIICSNNHGITWTKIPGSKSVPNITSITFIGNNQAIASTWGRGLWKIFFDGSKERPDIKKNKKDIPYKPLTLKAGNYEFANNLYYNLLPPSPYMYTTVNRNNNTNSLEIVGKYWSSDTSDLITFFIDEKEIHLNNVLKKTDGTFSVVLPKFSEPRVYNLKAIQKNMKGDTKEASLKINITTNDRINSYQNRILDSLSKENIQTDILDTNKVSTGKNCSKTISYWLGSPINIWPDLNGTESGNISIGGTNYDEKTGRLIANYSSPNNQYDAKHAFMLLATLKLSQVNPNNTVWNYAIACEKWLAGLRKITPDNIQVKNEKMIPILKQLENWINANLCK